jgi:hypothetical protein
MRIKFHYTTYPGHTDLSTLSVIGSIVLYLGLFGLVIGLGKLRGGDVAPVVGGSIALGVFGFGLMVLARHLRYKREPPQVIRVDAETMERIRQQLAAHAQQRDANAAKIDNPFA